MRPSLSALFLVAACASSGLEGRDHAVSSLSEDIIAGEFIIGAQVSRSMQQALGVELVDFDDTLGAGLYRADRGVPIATLEAALRQKVGGVRVENNRARQISAADPLRPLQWNLDMLDIETAWSWNTGAGVTVAVIDTGITLRGEDTPRNIIAGYDYVDDDWEPLDENGHGTHVAGTIAQATGNGKGAAGVAPDVNILSIRVLDRWGSGSAYWTAKAIIFAADNGADVINLSLGSRHSTASERDAVDYAFARGVVIVAASGNSYRGSVDYPAAYRDVIAVGAVGADGGVSAYSNGGSELDLVAPGGDISRDRNRDGYVDGILQETFLWHGASLSYEFFEGTSMASPHIAGVAALLLAEGARPEDVRDLLVETAADIESRGWDRRAGYGRVDPSAALARLGAPSGASPDGGDLDAPPKDVGDDLLAPTISDVSGWREGETMVLSWVTDEPSTSVVSFETYGDFGDDQLVLEHELWFTVDPTETYRFTVASTDAAGNVAEDGLWMMTP